MSDSNDLLNAIKMLGYLQSHSPHAISRTHLAEYLNCSTRSITRYGKKLAEIGVSSNRGRDGGYYYGGKDTFPFSFTVVDDVYRLNLALNSEYVLSKINQLNSSGIELNPNLIFSNSNIDKETVEKMVKITEAIYLKNTIKISYQRNYEYFDVYVAPICFKNYDGVVYLFAYYRDQIHAYDLRKVEFVSYLERTYEIRPNDIENIKKMPNHEIYGNDPVCAFRIRVNQLAYNRFKKAFKDAAKLSYDEPVSIVTIKTKSYREVISLLLSIGSNIEFVDKDNDVYRLYKDEVEKIARTFRK